MMMALVLCQRTCAAAWPASSMRDCTSSLRTPVAGVVQSGGEGLNRLVISVQVDVDEAVGFAGAGAGEVTGELGVVLIFSSIS